MDEFCGSPLWQSNLTWNITTQPDFTPCFQETILTWIPVVFLWLVAPLESISTYSSRRGYIPLTLLNLFKIFLTTVLCLLSLAELLEVFQKSDNETFLVEYVSPIAKSLTYVLVFFLLVIHRNRGVHTSGVLFIFWFLVTVTTLINTRSLLRSTFNDHTSETLADWNISELKFTIRIVSTPIILIQLILASIADKRAQNPFMTVDEEYMNRSPEKDCSILSLTTFSWLNPLIWLGYKRALTQDDIYVLSTSDRTENIYYKFEELLQPDVQRAVKEKRQEASSSGADEETQEPLIVRTSDQRASWIRLLHKQKSSTDGPRKDETVRRTHEQDGEIPASKYVGITGVIFKTFWLRLLVAAFLEILTSCITFASPILLNRIISFTKNDEPTWRGYFYAGILFLLSVIESLIENQKFRISSISIMRISTCVRSALYQKSLKLSQKGRRDFTSGQIVNLMSVDAQKVSDFLQNCNALFSAPIQLTISMVLLHQQLGIAVLAGIGVMLLSGPFNAWISVKLRELQQRVMQFKDKRIKLMTEVINGIKIIKIHAWEDSFKERVEDLRDKEIKNLTKQSWFSAGITFTFTSLSFVVALASFATFILLDPNNILDANRIFVSLSLFNKIRFPLAILPMVITNYSLFTVAVRRINRFLEADEIDPDMIKQVEDDQDVIKVTDGSFKWDSSSRFKLDKINIAIPRRKLVAVVGPVGSGKSTLLSAILGNVEKINGEVQFDKQSSLAYVPQEAWILNASIKNNIRLNKVLHVDKYKQVLEACALLPDLKTLPIGDESEIGEKGINLSGGQKQRISLARAVYSQADVYLFDDPLSAVDAHVGRHIFDEIIGPRGMLADRTRLMVTNKLSVLPDVDYILVLDDGQITESGTYTELLKSRGVFSKLLSKYLTENSPGVEISDVAGSDAITRELKRLENQQLTSKERETQIDKQAVGERQVRNTSHQKKMETERTGGNLTGVEVSQVGSVGLSVHLNFIRTMGMNFMVALCIYILSSVFTLSSNLWLSDWSNDAENKKLANDTTHRNIRLGVYAGLGIGESLCVIGSSILLNFACLRGSRILHNRMLSRVVRAPMSWFNTTPSGRIINRFSKDVDTIDSNLRFNVRLLMTIALRSVTSLILISVGSVYSLIFIVPIVLLYFLFQMFYISTSRQLKRIESTTRSPIYTHFSETVEGATSIRAFGADREFILQNNHLMDVNNSLYYLGFMTNRWLTLRLESLGFIVVLVASLAAILSRGLISPGTAGLSVTYSLTITQVLSFLVRTYSDYENNVVSVERLLEYTRTPVEPEDDEVPADPNWPSQGSVVFDDYSARYRPELDLVVKKFNLEVKPAEKVGLVGRTGAGKSSITLSLFRLFEAADGQIIIDQVNIATINLKVLRSKISIIPQEPILFTGTIRQNLDPTERCSDEQIWRSVELSHLSAFLRSLPDGLETQVSEGGSNFSVGQKQLFCLARALLRKSKILVLDEATAAVDLDTDNLIQQTIRREFKQSTILTIAHRLETIQDYDRVVVMENGSLAEEGPPAELVKKPNSKFHSLAKEAGLTK